ncbi:MAG: hypothetical protein N3A57_05140 [Negativicutes bacterium]|nr:hypothetical protein [Negativicutes bacterium]
MRPVWWTEIKDQGLSLVEVVVGMVVTVVLLAGLATVLNVAYRAGDKVVVGQTEAVQTARYAADTITRTLQMATGYKIDADGLGITFDGEGGTGCRLYIDRTNYCLYYKTPGNVPQPVAGDLQSGAHNTVINRMNEPLFSWFNGPDSDAVLIRIIVTDIGNSANPAVLADGQPVYGVQTAVVSLVRHYVR